MAYKLVLLDLIIILIAYSTTLSQPEWYRNVPSDYKNDYFGGMGDGASKVLAAQLALENAVTQLLNYDNTVTLELSPTIIRNTNREVITIDSIKSEIIRETAYELKIYSESRKIKGLKKLKTDFEREGNTYTAYVLIYLPKKNPISPPSAFSQVCRSLIPGWGQFYNGQTTKGFIFLGLDAGLIVAGWILQNRASADEVYAQYSRIQSSRDYYTNDANTYRICSPVAYFLAGVIYIWNIVDAIVNDREREVYADEQQQITMTEKLLPHPQYVLSINFRF